MLERHRLLKTTTSVVQQMSTHSYGMVSRAIFRNNFEIAYGYFGEPYYSIMNIYLLNEENYKHTLRVMLLHK